MLTGFIVCEFEDVRARVAVRCVNSLAVGSSFSLV